MIEVNQINNRIVSQCIYCGIKNVKLSDEHTYPFSLHTAESKIFFTLVKAVCKKCQYATHPIDSHFSEKILKDYRFLTNKRSRTKYKNYSRDRLIRFKNAQGNIIAKKVDIAEVGWMFTLPVFDLPGIYSQRENVVKGMATFNHLNMTGLNKLKQKYNFEEVEYVNGFNTDLLTRFIAKIAYCFTVLSLGYEEAKDSPLVEIILGKILFPESLKYIGVTDAPTMESAHGVGFKIFQPNSDRVATYVEMKILNENIPIYVAVVKTL